MGEVFLHPMMAELNDTRGPVSTTWGILPAVTLATGKNLFFNKNFYDEFYQALLRLYLQIRMDVERLQL
jgi:hypothetical protein